MKRAPTEVTSIIPFKKYFIVNEIKKNTVILEDFYNLFICRRFRG